MLLWELTVILQTILNDITFLLREYLHFFIFNHNL